jgi:hypothetical protein
MIEPLTKIINKIIIRKYKSIVPNMTFEIIPANLEYNDSMGVDDNTYLVRFKDSDYMDNRFPTYIESAIADDAMDVMSALGLTDITHKRTPKTLLRGYIDIVGNY